MTDAEHEGYARDILLSLSDDRQQSELVDFVPTSDQSRNAAKTMAAILCQRLGQNSSVYPNRLKNSNYEWKTGAFNCRNIADREYLWTNLRRNLADQVHRIAQSRPTAYLLSCCSPEDPVLNTWAIPEPLLYDILEQLPTKQGARSRGGQEYTIEISPDQHRIERFAGSPDLSPYFHQSQLSYRELEALQAAREIDRLAKEQRQQLVKAARALIRDREFDPSNIADSRERMMSSIVRRRGQPAFRKRLLAAYRSRCAISKCDVEAVLDGAHIVPYRGHQTNHVTNGLLLRTDLHTLFDLKLIAVDCPTMCILVAPSLNGSDYEKLRGMRLRVPNKSEWRPSEEALHQHRQESGL